MTQLEFELIPTPDFDTFQNFILQQSYYKNFIIFAPPIWVAQAQKLPTFAYVMQMTSTGISLIVEPQLFVAVACIQP